MVAAAAVLATVPPSAAAERGHGPVVTVTQGRLQGARQDGVARFLGIPYAAPPVGRLRWKPPQPAPHWPGTRPATALRPQCPQPTGSPQPVSGEDCLFLNVYAPARPSRAPLPVMVWIHGGSLVYGSGNDYDGSAPAARGNVVVTVNYRLGALGFLDLPSLAAESRDRVAGQYGLMDQQAALRWVRDNAAVFGGDRGNVTVFGESAGGGSTCAHLASPTAAGLFQRAIAQSVCGSRNPSQAEARQQGTAFAERVGCGNPQRAAACLRRMSLRAIVAEQGDAWSLAYGGPVLPESTDVALAHHHVHHVPVIVGSNHDEGTSFIYGAYEAPIPPMLYKAAIAHHFGPEAPVAQITRRYPLSEYGGDVRRALSTAFGDGAFSCAVHLAGRELSATQPVYAYEFNDPRPVRGSRVLPRPPAFWGAYHGSELVYVFQRTLDQQVLGRAVEPAFRPAQRVLSTMMAGYWSRFAATGNPNRAALPPWPPFTGAAEPPVQSLSPGVGGVHPEATFSADHQCGFWEPLLRKRVLRINLSPLPLPSANSWT